MLFLLALPATAAPLDEVADLPAVRTSLDRMTATATGREHLRASTARFEDHRRVVLSTLRAHDLPEELAAVPIVESGYRNLDASHNPVDAAGVWQFIPSTAQTHGLRVDDRVDERLDVRKETVAAASLLSELHDRYGDWGWALAAYNQGPHRVDRAIEAGEPLPQYAVDVFAAMLWMEEVGALHR